MELGLDRVLSLLKALNSPHTRVNIIHVTGTNGKGSVCAYVSCVLIAAGFKVGRFNSPHFIEIQDGTTINGQSLSPSEYQNLLDLVESIDKRLSIGATPFEKQTSIAFWWFDKENVDVAVMEVGIGGRLDATNVCSSPLISIITSIGIDHAALLGDTITAIASEKAGIMKPGCKAVIAPQTEASAEQTLVQHAIKIGCNYVVASRATWDLAKPGWATVTIPFPNSSIPTFQYPVSLNGDHQLDNSATALTAIEWLRSSNSKFSRITDSHILEGMRQTRWLGRLDFVKASAFPRLAEYGLEEILVDGAHNPSAAVVLRRYIDQILSKRGGYVHFVIGTTQGKDIMEMYTLLLRPGDTVNAVGFSQPETMTWIYSVNTKELVEVAKKSSDGKCEAKEFKDLAAALEWAGKQHRESGNLVVLCGSLYLVSDFYRLIKSN